LETAYPPELASDKPAIYSPQALIGFSAVFSALAGGILAFQSLRSAGQPAAARHALWTSIGFLAFTILLGQVLPRIPGLGLGLGYAWGYWLSQYLKKYVPDEALYPRKKVWKPLLICLLLTATVIGGAFFFAGVL
jgi:hypothetical protein